MLSRLRIAVVCLLGAVVLLAGPAWAQTPADAATALTRQLYDALLSSMKKGRALDFEQRRAALAPVIRRTFDLDLMTHLVVGRSWDSMGASERATLKAAFADWTISTYAARFNAFDGENFSVGKVTDGGRGTVVVHTSITPKGDAPVSLGYRVLKGRIIDIYLDNSISQLAVWRSEFSAVLKQGGIGGLVSRIHELTAKVAKDNS